ELLAVRIDVNLIGADDAALAPSASNDRSVAGLSTGRGENSLRDVHASHVFRASFAPNENDLLALGRPVFGFLRGEYCFPGCRARNSVDSFGDLATLEVLA